MRRGALGRMVLLTGLALALACSSCSEDDDGPVVPPTDTTAPSAITDLTMHILTSCAVALQWTAPGDDGTTGTAASYEVRYAASPITAETWASATPFPGAPAPGAAGTTQSLELGGIDLTSALYFAIRTQDEASNTSALSNVPKVMRRDPLLHIWRVPCDAATIQAGIDSAAAGDTVLVAAGTYNENVVMKSSVVLRSESGAALTTIDGGGLDAVVTLDGVNDAGIEGFSLRHGNGPAPGGGGIQAVNSTGFIRENVIAGNRSAQFGGGICLSGSTFTIEFNDVAYDSATSHGGGIALVDVSEATIFRNTIRFNTNLTFDTGGGGIYLDPGSYADITYNEIVRNIGGESHGGGGILCAAVETVISYNTIVNNGFRTPLPGSTDEPLHGPGAGILLQESVAIVTNNIIGQVTLVPHDYGSAVHSTASKPTPFANNDVWNSPTLPSIFPPYSGDMEDLTGIDGNIRVDPELCDPDLLEFAPQSDSPCVTASESGGVIGALEPGCAKGARRIFSP